MNRKLILPSLATLLVAMPTAFADTNAKSSLWICETPQNEELSAAEFAALTWVKIGKMGELGATGTTTNILTYDTWDTDVVDKAKGMSNAGDPTIEVSRTPTDPGQIILNAASLTNFKYALRVLRNDKPDATGTPTTIYHRGLITGPTHPNGRNEDFDLDIFTAGLVQREIIVNPAPGV